MTSNFLKSGPGGPGSFTSGGKGRVNIRYKAKRNTYRFRFFSIHPDQAETILQALAVARETSNTEFDVVALDAICQHFLATFD